MREAESKNIYILFYNYAHMSTPLPFLPRSDFFADLTESIGYYMPREGKRRRHTKDNGVAQLGEAAQRRAGC